MSDPGYAINATLWAAAMLAATASAARTALKNRQLTPRPRGRNACLFRGQDTNRLAPVGNGGLADHKGRVNLTLQGRRAVFVEAGHQHGPGLICKIVRGLSQGRNKGLERCEPFRIVEREQ